MNLKPELTSAEIERLLVSMVANDLLDVELTDSDIDMLLTNGSPISRAEQFTAQALAKMQSAQQKREQLLPSFNLGQHFTNARLSCKLTLQDAAKQADLSINELESLESGILSINQIIRKFPSKVMFRILSTIRFTVQDFSDQLSKAANKSSFKSKPTEIYARSRQSPNTNSARLVETVADYVSELQQLFS